MSVNEDPSTWNISTLGGIPIKLKSSSYSFGEESSTAQEVYVMRATDLLSFVLESFPLPYIFLGSVWYPRRRYLPGLASLTTKKIQAKSLDGGLPIDPFSQYSSLPSRTFCQFVEVTVEYGTTQENDSDRDPNDPWTFLEISSRATGQYLTTGARNADWLDVGGGVDSAILEIDVAATMTEQLVEHTAKWSQIPYAWYYATLVPRLRSMMGKVNSKVMPLFFNAPIETILLQSYSANQQFTWRSGFPGASPIQLEIGFLEKNFEGQSYTGKGTIQVTHQHMYRPGKGWQRIQINGQPPYPTADLNTMFAP